MYCDSLVWELSICAARLRTSGTWAYRAPYSSMPTPPWWWRSMSCRNRTSISVPVEARSRRSSSGVAMPGIAASPLLATAGPWVWAGAPTIHCM